MDTPQTNLLNDKGRGVIIYTHESLDKSTIQIEVSNKFEEACLLEIRLRGGDVLLFGCIYRSPTSTPETTENNENLNNLLRSISDKSYSHVCLVGDFNYRDISWKSWTTPHGENSKEVRFIEAVRDCFLFQHIEESTRTRGNDEPSLIDLLLTNEEMQVSNVVHHSPLGKSDHSVITFNYHCYLDFSKPKICYNYRKADYDGMKSELETSNWMETFMSEVKDMDPETQWTLFKGKMLELRNQFVPKRTIKAGNEGANKGSFPIDKQVQQAINDKHTLHRRWRKGKRYGSTPQREAYTRSQRKVKRLIRQSKRAFEKGLAERSKNNPKEM